MWFGDLNDFSLVAKKVGAVRRVVCASPSYLARRGTPNTEDLKDHDCITFENTLSAQSWAFKIGKTEKSFPIHSRLVVSTAEAATDAAVRTGTDADLVTRSIVTVVPAASSWYWRLFVRPQASPFDLRGREAPAIKIRTFLDFAAPRLKKAMQSLAE